MVNITFKTLLIITVLMLNSCTSEKKIDPWKEGQVVTWKQNNHLIVRAKLGTRRQHIIDTQCERCERDFYNPDREHYLGQFESIQNSVSTLV